MTADVRALAAAVVPDWPLIDRIWGEVARANGAHLQRQTGSPRRSFLEEAFAVAALRDFLETFVDELLRYGLIRPATRLRDLVTAMGGNGDLAFEFQAFIDSTQFMGDGLVLFQGGLDACRYICRVDVDGEHAGTGVYLGDGLVATAAHVLGDLVTDTTGGLAAGTGSLARLSLTFGYAMKPAGGGRRILRRGTVAPLHRDWLYWGSRTEPDPVDENDVTGVSPQDGPWDLALIRLAAPLLLPSAPELRPDPPRVPAAVFVFQHPHGASAGGQSLFVAHGRLERHLGEPAVRFLHSANTQRGSSGAPLFDQDWRMVGIHQGGPVPGGVASAATPVRNRAVPVRFFAGPAARLGLTEADTPLITELRQAPGGGPGPYPVIGRVRTQQRLWRGLARHAPAPDRLLVIRGAPGTGRRFSSRLVREYVERAGDPVITFDLSGALDCSAEQLADRITRAIPADPTVIRGDGMTTGAREIRNGILPALSGLWHSDAADHPVWLLLGGAESEAFRITPPIRDVVSGIIGALGDLPALRLVLLGWEEPVPPGFGASIDELTEPTADEISGYLLPPGEEPGPRLRRAAAAAMAQAAADGWTGYGLAATAVEILRAAPATARTLRKIWARRSEAERELFQARPWFTTRVTVPDAAARKVLQRAALSGAVSPEDLIRDMPADEGERALDVLQTDFDRVRAAERWAWTLRSGSRHDVLRTMSGDTLRLRLKDVAEIPTDTPGERLRELCAGTGGPEPDVQALTWAAPLRGRLSDLAEAHRLAAVRRLLDDHRLLVHEGVFGRTAVLDRLRDFAGEPVDSARPVPVLAVTGIGGSGKSTVLAEFARPYLEGLMTPPPGGPLPVVIDFDRLRFRPGRELEMSFEVTRQLGTAHPEAGADFAALRHQALEGQHRTDSDRYGAAHAVDQDRRAAFRFDHDAAVIVRLHRLGTRPVLVLLDTFEEWQRERPRRDEDRGPGNDSERDLLAWLTRLRQDMGLAGLKVVVAGRAAPGGTRAEVVHLGDLDVAARRELLTAHGMDSGQATRIAARFGNPLTLRIAARILPSLGPTEEAALFSEDISVPSLDEAIRWAVLYQRHLGHVADPRARAVTHPGLILRRLSAAVVQQVVAPACRLGELDDASALDLMRRLEDEVWLVRRAHDGLRHHTEVRRAVLRLMIDDPAERDAVARINQAAIEWYGSDRHDLTPQAAAREVLYHRLLLDPPDFVVTELGSTPAQRGELDALGDWAGDFTPRIAGQIRALRGDPDLTAAEITALPQRAWETWAQRHGRELVDSGRARPALRLFEERALRTEPEWLAQAFCESARWQDHSAVLRGYESSPGKRRWAGRYAVVNAVITGGDAAVACLRWLSRHIATLDVIAGSQDEIVERLFYSRLLAERAGQPWPHRSLAERLLVSRPDAAPATADQFPVDQLRRALTWAAAGAPGAGRTLRQVTGLYRPEPQWLDDMSALAGVRRDRGTGPEVLRSDEILGDQARRFATGLGDAVPLIAATVYRPHVLRLLRGDNPELLPAVRLALSSRPGGPDLANLATIAGSVLPWTPADLEPGRMPVVGAPETDAVLARLVDYVDCSGRTGRFLAAVFRHDNGSPLIETVHRAFVIWDDVHRRMLDGLAWKS
ncbi:S1 family peptidase [Actinoplanes derwentensis]|uniref:AAA ATPase domain-containing protein n=1 Tax=Actinoplanes derwentensis TaxID=113562 RepID=A0A1H2AWZ0_9ACTN|nr:serine protease [Actinoplanes derwentensis]GID87271.1 hypothetical protein Ade03nite_61950 [Actinoplanes derwentensis]SDT50434.1 AAA ATPase domain-containing protein [Actinoplanes derwentensis]